LLRKGHLSRCRIAVIHENDDIDRIDYICSLSESRCLDFHVCCGLWDKHSLVLSVQRLHRVFAFFLKEVIFDTLDFEFCLSSINSNRSSFWWNCFFFGRSCFSCGVPYAFEGTYCVPDSDSCVWWHVWVLGDFFEHVYGV